MIVSLAICWWGWCTVPCADASFRATGAVIYGVVDSKAVTTTERAEPERIPTGRRVQVRRAPSPRTVYLLRLRDDDWSCGFTSVCPVLVVSVPRDVYEDLSIGNRWHGQLLAPLGGNP